jgi:hypothetical protein
LACFAEAIGGFAAVKTTGQAQEIPVMFVVWYSSIVTAVFFLFL